MKSFQRGNPRDDPSNHAGRAAYESVSGNPRLRQIVLCWMTGVAGLRGVAVLLAPVLFAVSCGAGGGACDEPDKFFSVTDGGPGGAETSGAALDAYLPGPMGGGSTYERAAAGSAYEYEVYDEDGDLRGFVDVSPSNGGWHVSRGAYCG